MDNQDQTIQPTDQTQEIQYSQDTSTEIDQTAEETSEAGSSKTKIIITQLLLVFIGFMVGMGVSYFFPVSQLLGSDDPAASSNTSQDSSTSTTPSPSANTAPKGDPYKGWSVYYDKNYDISLKYPPTWEVKETRFELVKDGEGISKKYNLEEYCKNLKTCLSGFALNIGPKDKINNAVPVAELESPHEPRLSECEDCEEVKLDLKIRGNKYEYTILKEKNSDTYYSLGRTLPDITAGYKSSWKKFNVSFRAGDKKALDDFVNIINSIQ
jgi:hypothetical protein